MVVQRTSFCESKDDDSNVYLSTSLLIILKTNKID